MSFFSKLFGNKKNKSVGNMDEYMFLVRVYLQSTIATHVGITNINMIPDVAKFKRTMNIPTEKGKLGLGEKTRSKKILTKYYGMKDIFFTGLDKSVRKSCKNINQVNSYFAMFQGFSNDLFLIVGNLMQWKFRVPSFFKNAFRSLTEQTVHDICTKTDWKEADQIKTTRKIKKYREKMGLSEEWITEYVYHVLLLAKKEKKNKND